MTLLTYRSLTKQAGMLLLEYLIAMALFAIVLLYIDSIFGLHSRVMQLMRTQNSDLAVLRQISLQLGPQIRQNGYQGCQSNNMMRMLLVHKAKNNTWQPSLPESLSGKVKNNTDVLILEQVGGWTVSLLQDMQANSDTLLLPGVAPGDHEIYIIDDCETAELFYAVAYQCGIATCLKAQHALQKAYRHHAVVSPWVKRAYYLTPDNILQSKLLQPEQAAHSMHEKIESWQLTLRPRILQIDLKIAQEYSLWFEHSL